MAPSDDDECSPQIVTNYYFVDENEILISFTAVPFYFDENAKSDTTRNQVFLRGTADGCLKVSKQVYSWKLKFQEDRPEILVLVRGSKWLKVQKPMKSYVERFRSIMITIAWLVNLKWKPDASEDFIWGCLHGTFRSLDVEPTKTDLGYHASLIKMIAERDKTLANAKLLVMYLKEAFGKGTNMSVGEESSSVAKSPLNSVDNVVDEGSEGTDREYYGEEPGLFDSVCAFCDNGGEILCCEGKCLRSFHPTKDACADTCCESLGYSMAQLEAILNFFCDNCQSKKHQCFACGRLGSSDKESGAEVFRCASATCGHFYHPNCVAPLLIQESELEERKFQKKVASGEPFICPVHKCTICNGRENNEVHELQFAVCRRCPTSYHRKCMPRDIVFADLGQDIFQRAWEDLLPHRILMYCMKHKIDEFLRTPIRNHIIFPNIPGKKKPVKIKLKKFSDGLTPDRSSAKACRPIEKRSNMEVSFPVADNMLLRHSTAYTELLDERTDSDPSKVCTRDKSRAPCPVSPALTEKKFHSSFPQADNETIERLKSLMDEVSSSLTLKDIISKQKIPSTHNPRHFNRSVTLGKVEGSVEAIRTALQKLDSGASIDDAKAVCEPKLLNQIVRWKKNFQVYLAPILHGMRYTSFGRHFTNVVKLEEIVDKLQWYVRSGDMIVDFCCGANDFSRLLKEKLEAARKMCSFKNYDIIRPKDDFNFEERDWMSVEEEELPKGSRLIMGLNPPFGVKASLANKFIDKALTFRPKLLILIVPEETERLDVKDPPYDLIWMDSKMLSGKSFYLPGSIDIDEKQMQQWNWKSPPLYLWSRCDWAEKHKKIAIAKGHADESQYEGRIATSENVDLRKSFEKRKWKKNHSSYDRFNPPDNGYGGGSATTEDVDHRKSIKKRKLKKNHSACDRSNSDNIYEGRISTSEDIQFGKSFQMRKQERNHEVEENMEESDYSSGSKILSAHRGGNRSKTKSILDTEVARSCNRRGLDAVAYSDVSEEFAGINNLFADSYAGGSDINLKVFEEGEVSEKFQDIENSPVHGSGRIRISEEPTTNQSTCMHYNSVHFEPGLLPSFMNQAADCNKKALDQNLGGLEGEVSENLQDMENSPVDGSAHTSIYEEPMLNQSSPMYRKAADLETRLLPPFLNQATNNNDQGLDQNRRELEGEASEKLLDTENPPSDRSNNISICEEPNQSSSMDYKAVDFERGLLHSFMNQAFDNNDQELDQNLKELEGEASEKLQDTEKSPFDKSDHISISDYPRTNQSIYYSSFNDFAPGPLPSFMNEEMSCGWLDD